VKVKKTPLQHLHIFGGIFLGVKKKKTNKQKGSTAVMK
jgi:hypothetical protein